MPVEFSGACFGACAGPPAQFGKNRADAPRQIKSLT
jgi:hypothetical protein